MTNIKFVRCVLYMCTGINVIQVFKYIVGGYRQLHSSGWVFDALYGTETALNLASDVFMIQALQLPKDKETKQKLKTFLGWNCGTTCFCYVTSLFLAGFASQHLTLDKEMLQKMDEKEAREQVRNVLIVLYTIIFVVKGGILYGIYQCYLNWDKAAEGETDAQAYVFQAAGQSGAPGQPYYIAAPQPFPGAQQPVPGGPQMFVLGPQQAPGGPQMFVLGPQPLAPGAQPQAPGGPTGVVYIYGGMPGQAGPLATVQPSAQTAAPVAGQQRRLPHLVGHQPSAEQESRR